MFKKYKQLICGFVIGVSLIGIPTIANEIKTFIAEEASFPVVVDGKPIELDMPVVTIEGRTYLPLRAIGDVLGVKVDWNAEKNQAEISKGGFPMEEEKKYTSDGIEIYNINNKEYIRTNGLLEKYLEFNITLDPHYIKETDTTRINIINNLTKQILVENVQYSLFVDHSYCELSYYETTILPAIQKELGE